LNESKVAAEDEESISGKSSTVITMVRAGRENPCNSQGTKVTRKDNGRTT
jgi:hypothetical protein